MTRLARLAWTGALLALLSTPATFAQYLSEKVYFEGPPINDPATSQEMFRVPEYSPTTTAFILHNSTGLFDYNVAYRSSSMVLQGTASEQINFRWDPNNPLTANYGWVRVTTASAPGRPNPSVHQGGKIRFLIRNRSELFRGKFGLAIGIRETANNVPQMEDGGTTGTIEWVGVTGVGTDPNGAVYPIPALVLPNFTSPRRYEFDLATGIVTNITTPGSPVVVGGGFGAMTGDGVLDPNARGVFEHLAVTKFVGDTASLIDFAVDEIEFEAPVPDPTVAPVVDGPLIATASPTTINVRGIQWAANRVRLWKNNAQLVGEQVLTQPTPKQYTFNVPSLVGGDQYYATVRNGQTGQESAPSNIQVVFSTPPPYSVSLLIDEGGTGSCDFNTGWEFVGASGLQGSWAPTGFGLIPNSAIWQTVDIPLDDPALVQASVQGGNGVLLPSPTGFYTIDSFWFTVEPNTPLAQAGPWDVFLDSVQLLDGSGQPYKTILPIEDGISHFPFVRGQSAEQGVTNAINANASYDGANSQRWTWTWDYDANTPPVTIDPTKAFGMLQRIGSGCATSELIEDTASAIRLHLCCREYAVEPNVPLPIIQGPVVGNQSAIIVTNDATATQLQVFKNGTLVGSVTPVGSPTQIPVALATGDSVAVKQVLPGPLTSDYSFPRAAAPPLPPTIQRPILVGATTVTVQNCLTDPNLLATASTIKLYRNGVFLTSAAGGTATVAVPVLANQTTLGAEIKATQVVNGAESLFSVPVVVGAVPQAPVIFPPIMAGDLTVKVGSVEAGANLVTVYDANTPIGSINPNGLTVVDVPVTALVHLHQLSAATTNPSGEGARSAAKEVGRGNGPLSVTLGIREAVVDPNLGIGNNGGSSTATIEWVGSSVSASGAPQGKPLTTGPNWQTITFDPNVDPIRGFTGDGILSTANGYGILEHLALAIDANSPTRSVGTYQIFIDNIVNVGAGPSGGDVLLQNGFESATIGNETFFQEPGFSGSTSANFEPNTPNFTRVSDQFGSNSNNSLEVQWYFVSSTASRWVRLTTSGYNPIINLRKPVRFDLLVLDVLPPTPPVLANPIEAGDTFIHVTGINPAATSVQLFANVNTQIANINPNGNTALDVPIAPAAVYLNAITAKQFVPGKGFSGRSNALEVGKKNGDIRICIGVRETTDTGPLGSPGQTTGAIEFVGTQGPNVSGAPQGIPVSPSANWQTLTFPIDPNSVENFSGGNGTLDGTRGVLEHLALTANSASANRSAGSYRLYVDNVVNVGAGAGGADFVLTDFDNFDVGSQVLFWDPAFSGSTALLMLPTPRVGRVTDAYSLSGNHSYLLEWCWRNTNAGSWARTTTSGVANLPRPIIDVTKPIRMDVLLLAECTKQFDFDGSGVVAGTDWPSFVSCLAGVDAPTAPACNCADADEDGRVDMYDFAEFQAAFGH